MSPDHLSRAGLMKFFIVEPILDIARYDLACFHIDPCAQVSDLQIDLLGSGIVRIILLEHSQDYKDVDEVVKWAQSSGVSPNGRAKLLSQGSSFRILRMGSTLWLR